MDFSFIVQMQIDGIEVFRIDVAFLKLAVRSLLREETEHFVVSDGCFHEHRRMSGGLFDGVSGTELNRCRAEVSDEHMKGFVADDICDSGCHEAHFVREHFRIRLDQDKASTFRGDFDPSLGVAFEYDTFCDSYFQ